MKKVYMLISIVFLLLVGCSKDVSTQNPDTPKLSSTFNYPVTFGDGKKGEYILIGEKGKVAFQIGSGEKGKGVVNPIVEGKTDKYMWYFWGKDEELKGKMRVEGISEKGKKETILTASSLGIGASPIEGANATLPSNMVFSKPGKWKLNVYIADKLFGKFVIYVQPNS
ncbi:hypothetical protein AB1282_20010 [Gottfriedia sp. S16(2024)]|uniref:hypothetical protein n=1 Tax=Gottfriedia sp. S16(2024) TaxID=3162883 RepID=UPI003D1DDB27